MNIYTSKVGTMSVLLIVIIVSGTILSKLGRPLNAGVFAIHKVFAVSTIALLVVNIKKLVQVGDIEILTTSLIALTFVLFIVLVVSGGFLSFERSLPLIALRIHQITPLLAVASAIISLVLLLKIQV